MLQSILAILLTILIVAALPVCVLRPWIGVLVFAWIGLMNPHRLVGGFAYTMPYAKMVAIATLAGLLVTKERYSLPRTREVYLIAALWVTFVSSTVFVALQPEAAWEKLAEVSKILLMTGVTIVLFQDRHKLDVLLLVIALSIGYFGVTGGVWSLYTGFADRLYGPPASALGDNNDLGFALTLILPILVLLRRQFANAWIRRVLLATFALSIVAVFGTYSRGGLICLCVALPLILALTWRRDVPVILAAVETDEILVRRVPSGAGSSAARRRILPVRAGRLRTLPPGVLGQPRRAQSLPAGLRRTRLHRTDPVHRTVGVPLPHPAANRPRDPRRSGPGVDPRLRAIHRREPGRLRRRRHVPQLALLRPLLRSRSGGGDPATSGAGARTGDCRGGGPATARPLGARACRPRDSRSPSRSRRRMSRAGAPFGGALGSWSLIARVLDNGPFNAEAQRHVVLTRSTRQ